jgi:hypothetical protein
MPLSNPSSVNVTLPSNTSNTVGRSAVNASTTSATLFVFNAARKGATIWNNSTANLYIELGAASSTTSAFAVKITADGYYELPFNYIGQIAGVWDAANGSALLREFT